MEVVDLCHFPGGLGFFDELESDAFTEAGFRLAENDVLFVGTDGVTEAAKQGDYHKGLFEEARLLNLIKAQAKQPLERFKDKLIADLDQFTGGVYHDDVTFVILRAKGPEQVS